MDRRELIERTIKRIDEQAMDWQRSETIAARQDLQKARDAYGKLYRVDLLVHLTKEIKALVPDAVSVELEMISESDDNGGSYERLSDVILFDADGFAIDQATLGPDQEGFVPTEQHPDGVCVQDCLEDLVHDLLDDVAEHLGYKFDLEDSVLVTVTD